MKGRDMAALPGRRLSVLQGHLNGHEVRNLATSLSSNVFLNGANDHFPTPLHGQTFSNWANIYTSSPLCFFYPKSQNEIIQIILRARKEGAKVKVVGAGHSPNDIAMTSSWMVSLQHYNQLLALNKETCVVKVQGGIAFDTLSEILENNGLAFPNLGSISEQSISGAISTATHGTGTSFGVLAEHIVGMEIINAKGEVIKCGKQGPRRDIFLAAQCGIGAIGIISTLTLQCEPSFLLDEVYEPMAFDDMLESIASLSQEYDHTRVWWVPHTNRTYVWKAKRVDKQSLVVGARQGGDQTTKNELESVYKETLKNNAKILKMFEDSSAPKGVVEKAKGKLNFFLMHHMFEFLLWLSTYNPSMVKLVNKIFGFLAYRKHSHSVGLSHRIFTFDCLFKQYVNEWAIPAKNLKLAMTQLKKLIETSNFSVHFPVEIRFVKGDEIYLSPCYGRDSCYIGIIMYRPYGKDFPGTTQYFAEYQKIMLGLGGRPHWAKRFDLGAKELQQMYPQWTQFLQIRNEVDPYPHLFENPFLARTLGSSL